MTTDTCTGCEHPMALHDGVGCTATWPCGCGSPDAMDACFCEETS